MGEHVFFGKLAASGVCETDRFHIPSIRVCPPQEDGAGMCGGHIMGEHALSGKLTVNIACGADRLRYSPFGCALRKREHVFFGKMTTGVVSRTGGLHIPFIRVLPSAGVEKKLHLLSPTF